MSETSSPASPPIRVLVWDEQQPEQRPAYPNFLGHAIAAHLAQQPGLVVGTARLDDPEQGLAAPALEATDVLVWWGHRRHSDVEEERAVEIARRVEAGRLALLALHSAHWSRPFIRAMEARTIALAKAGAPAGLPLDLQRPPVFRAPKPGDPLTPSWRVVERVGAGQVIEVALPGCGFPAWRNEGGPSRTTTLLPAHPIARGVPAEFALRETEMYSEPFHVPAPDAVIFEETWATGERFRSGMAWTVGRGRVFYFGPGHETYDTFLQEVPLRIVANAVRWLASGA